MRLAIILGIVSIALLWGGGQGIFIILSCPEPVPFSCAEYVAERPTDKWLRLDRCVPQLADGVSLDFWRGVNELYLPLLPAGAAEDSAAVLILRTDDPELLRLYGRLQELRAAPEPDEEAIADLLTGPVAAATRERELTGLILFGIELDDDDRQDLARDLDHVVSDFVIIVDGLAPDPTWSFVSSGIGLLMAIAAVLLARRST